MEDSLAKKVERYIRSRHQKKHRTQLLRCLALLVAFATVYALIVPAVTLSNETVCGMEAHVHDESCWSVELASPQPQLVCGAGKSGEILIHTHDSYCYDDMGNLICELPEREFHSHSDACYQEIKEYTCTEVQDLGHTHDASCFAYDKGELICGLEEGQGAHTHTDACYPTERVDEPVCGMEEAVEGNPEGKPPHTHDESCYTVVVRQRLKCGLEECDPVLDEEGNVLQEGHHHDSSCYMTDDELRICGQQEAQGHVHVRECWEWTQRQICTEEERAPGHIHTEECYVISRVLACEKQELVCHTHEAACYDENGVLICTLPEVGLHQHTSECRYVPEGGPEEVRTLICGKEEHIHTDACYMEIHPEQTKYYCGLDEHIHGSECYFESGSLYCTLTEHMHTAECLEEPLPAESEPPQESDDPAPSETPEPPKGVMLEDYTYVYENDAFTVTYHISGFALLPEQAQPDPEPSGEPEPATTDDPSQTADPEPANTDDVPQTTDDPEPVPTDGEPQTPEPDPEPTQDVGQPQEGGGLGEVELDEGGYVEIPLAARPGLRRMASYSGGADSSGPPEIELEPDGAGSVTDPGGDAVSDSAPMPTADTELDPALVEFNVEELVEGDPEYQQAAANAQTELGEEDSTVMGVLKIALYAGGQKLDLTNCEVSAVIEATQELKDAMETQAAMTADENDPLPGEDGENPEESQETEEASFVMTDEQGGVLAFAKVSEPMVVTLENEIMVLSAVAPQPYPVFQVQYYAYLHTVDTKPNANVNKPTLINTDNGGTGGNGKLPVNGNLNLPAIHMEVNADGTIQTLASNGTVTKIFNDHKFSYETAPHRNYIDIVTKQEGNYKLAEIWVMEADGETVKKDADGKEMKYTHTAEKPIQLTNNATTAGKFPGEYVLVQDDTILRMVYETTDGGMNVDTNFHDYDISDGKVYNSASKSNVAATWPGQNSSGKYMYTKDTGIHTLTNYSGTGAKYAFGNGDNVSTGLGKQMLGGYFINRANNGNDGGGASFQNCSFKLVQDTLPQSGELQFSSGIAAPNLFSGSAVGRTDYNDGSLGFTRKGDTYTLSTASVGGNTLGNLDKLAYNRKNWNETLTMFSNEFWPLDKVASAGTAGHDLMFGKSVGQHYTFGDEDLGTRNTLESDYKHAPQNGLHNPYFGMDFSVNFTVYPDYVGPLEYYFFGDDDMWVYLTECDKDGNPTKAGKLICDIGGVHGAVGEYVNLWDYIPKNDKLVDDSDPDKATDAKETHYKLSFFYTERGASGSTCWMQFTLPELRSSTFRTPTSTDYATLEIGKAVLGPPAEGKKFHFTLQLMNADGTFPTDITASVYQTGGSAGGMGEITGIDWQTNNGILEFDLEDGQTIFLKDLPKGIQYTITEDTYDGYNTSYTVTDVDTNGGSKTETPVEGTVASGTLTGGHIVTALCRNSSSYELPATGSAGAWYTMAGLPLTLAALCVWYKKKPHGKGAVR